MNNDELRNAMVREWGLSEYPVEKQDEYIEQIGQLIYQAIIIRTTDEMDEAAKDALDVFMQQQGEEADMATSLDYLRAHVANFDQIAIEETAKIKERVTAPKV